MTGGIQNNGSKIVKIHFFVRVEAQLVVVLCCSNSPWHSSSDSARVGASVHLWSGSNETRAAGSSMCVLALHIVSPSSIVDHISDPLNVKHRMHSEKGRTDGISTEEQQRSWPSSVIMPCPGDNEWSPSLFVSLLARFWPFLSCGMSHQVVNSPRVYYYSIDDAHGDTRRRGRTHPPSIRYKVTICRRRNSKKWLDFIYLRKVWSQPKIHLSIFSNRST